MKLHNRILIVCCVFTSFFFNTAVGQTTIEMSEFYKKNVGISGLRFSPDGRSLIYSVSKPDWENNRRKQEYFLFELTAKTSRPLQFKEKNVSQLQWSPSGKYLTYTGVQDTAGAVTAQVFVKDIASGEVKRITSSPSSVVGFQWSPNETALLYAAKDLPGTRTGQERFVTAFEVGNNGYTATTKPLSTHLYLTDKSGSAARQLTVGTTSETGAVWLNDHTVMFTQTVSPYTGDITTAQLMIMDLTADKAKPFAPGYTTQANVMVAPDKNIVAFTHPRNNIPANISDITIMNANGSGKTVLTENFDRAVLDAEWLPDGKSLLMAVANLSKIDFVRLGTDKKAEWLPVKDVTTIGEFTVNDKTGQVALVGATMTGTAELYLFDPVTKATVKLTEYNDFLKSYAYGRTEHIEWPVSDGLTADGIVTYPPNFDKNKKYPLVLYIHGGPTAASFLNYSPFVQALAANGWVVLQPNYRGSLNRGNRFQNAISNDGGAGPGDDIVKGIEVLKRKGNIDEKKIAVSGWSYGGFMTAWLIGKYPNMWKAAVAGAAPVDLTDMTSLTDNNVSIRHAITSSPWKGDNLKKYMDMSPITNLPKAKAPTLVMSVTGDERVSITGSYKIYHALKANKIPVQFIAYPGSAHFPPDLANQNDVYRRWIEWLKKYLD